MDSKRQIKILYIDDEAINILNFKVLFNDRYKVFTSLSIDESIEVIEMEKPDIIFCDQKMPEKKGTEFFNDLVESNGPGAEAPKVIITGYIENQEINASLSSKIICAVVYKPIQEKQIHEIVAKYVGL